MHLSSEATLDAVSHRFEDQSSSVEYWAMNRAHQIVVHHGMSLTEAAQCLDRKRTSAITYALRKAIMDCLVEALTQGAQQEVTPAE